MRTNELDLSIQEASATESEYRDLLVEINRHIQGDLVYTKLTQKAKDLIDVWEQVEADINERG